MNYSVFSQCDTNKYFSLSTINPDVMKTYGLNMTVQELQAMARKRNPYNVIMTGSDSSRGHLRRTNIFRYEDFKDPKEVEE